MSRSTRKSPKIGITTATSEKLGKRLANRANRRLNNQIMAKSADDANIKPIRETSKIWAMDKDGKQHFDPLQHPELMPK